MNRLFISYISLLNLFFICLLSLTSCRIMRTSEKAVSERETASVTESRLSFYRTIDSLSRQLSMSVDSISIIFTEFPTTFTSELKGCTEAPSDSLKAPRTPHKVKVYGLHLNENIEKKSVEQTDLKDSVTAVTQSEKSKSAKKQSSSTNYVLKDIFFILILVCILYIIYRCRRFLKNLL